MTTSDTTRGIRPIPLGTERRESGIERHVSILVPALLLWLLTWFGLLAVNPQGGVFELELSVQTPRVAQARIYFDRGQDINLSDSSSAWLQPGQNVLRFPIGPGAITRFRLDTQHGSGPLHIRSVRILPARYRSALAISLDRIGAGDQIDRIHRDASGVAIYPTAGGGHPKLWIDPPDPITIAGEPGRSLLAAISAAILVLLALLLWRYALVPRWSWRTGVGTSLLVAFLLAWTMAWQSPISIPTHPDELAHLWCFQYFLGHLLPPAVDDPEIIQTLSIYGFSYLFEMDVVYALAARTFGALSTWFGSELHAARCFNLTLLLVLACMAWRRSRWAICLLPLLLSPQIWYVFAYFNADALPLFLAFVAACIAADEDSGLNRFCDTRERLGASTWIFIAVLGLLLVSKRNYLPLVPILGLWLAVRHLDIRTANIAAILSGLLTLGAGVHLKAVPGWAASGAAAAGIGRGDRYRMVAQREFAPAVQTVGNGIRAGICSRLAAPVAGYGHERNARTEGRVNRAGRRDPCRRRLQTLAAGQGHCVPGKSARTPWNNSRRDRPRPPSLAS